MKFSFLLKFLSFTQANEIIQTELLKIDGRIWFDPIAFYADMTD